MPRGYPFQGLYDPFGHQRRNHPVEVPPVNPLPPNAKEADTGDAGQDGYSVFSRASRATGERPDIGPAYEEFRGPKLEDE